jgi:hypothetical protein
MPKPAAKSPQVSIKPQRVLLKVAVALFLLWTLALLTLYFTTVFPHRTPGALTNYPRPLPAAN